MQPSVVCSSPLEAGSWGVILRTKNAEVERINSEKYLSVLQQLEREQPSSFLSCSCSFPLTM
jgi:hypothetical protein